MHPTWILSPAQYMVLWCRQAPVIFLFIFYSHLFWAISISALNNVKPDPHSGDWCYTLTDINDRESISEQEAQLSWHFLLSSICLLVHRFLLLTPPFQGWHEQENGKYCKLQAAALNPQEITQPGIPRIVPIVWDQLGVINE